MELKEVLSDAELTSFLGSQNAIFINNHGKHSRILEEKFNRIYENTRIKMDIVSDPKMFANLTTLDVPENIKWLCGLGPKFAAPADRRQLPILRLVTDVEDILTHTIDEEQKEIKRARVAHVIKNSTYEPARNGFLKKYTDLAIKETKKFLREHDDVILSRADKGNSSVLMYRATYEEKMALLLADSDSYKIIRRNPTEILTKKNIIHWSSNLKMMGQ